MNTKTTDIGVIVGRFQVPRLHEAHIDLIQTVCDKHAKVIIFLGLSAVFGTKNNPLDFESRKKMILEKFPDVNVFYIPDHRDDGEWSKNLDRMLSNPHHVAPGKTVTLYGSRDSFISHYIGKFPTQELVPTSFISGTELRKLSGTRTKGSEDWREGVTWCTQNQYDKVHPTVDVAPIDKATNRILLGRKPNESLYRFVGGYASTEGDGFEDDALRELKEETSLTDVSKLEYISSAKVDDWCYRGERDKIKTIFYLAYVNSGTPVAGDDICEVKWFDLNLGVELKRFVVPEHHMLVDRLITHRGNL